jgi:hypothetical protein
MTTKNGYEQRKWNAAKDETRNALVSVPSSEA